MNKKLQRTERYAFYHLPIHCGFCGKLACDFEGQIGEPCKHVLFVAHEEGFEYLAERAAAQLVEKGFAVEGLEDGSIHAERVAGEEDLDIPDSITDEFEFADGVKVVAIVGPPSASETYVGFAPVEGE
jgi:hypothetical protein